MPHRKAPSPGKDEPSNDTTDRDEHVYSIFLAANVISLALLAALVGWAAR